MSTAKKVLLGFSGGIDSTRAAAILHGRGYLVTALYLDMYGDGAQSGQAMAKAEDMGLDFRVLNIRNRFGTCVIDYFLSEYLAGRTPAPCTVCNRDIKWRVLYETAMQEGYDHIATGHYFNISVCDGKYYVCKAADKSKDQSYYLWPLSQDILSMALTPMGDQIKSEIKESLPAAEKKESMGLCFLGGRGVRDFLKEKYGRETGPGDIMDSSGAVVGLHEGTPFYTIGQKRGLGLDSPSGMCVTGIDAAGNRLIVGTDDQLYHNNLIISGCNIPDPAELVGSEGVSVKIRGIGRNPQGYCKITRLGDTLHIKLEYPAWACAPGQPVVLYIGDRVVGGGSLEKYF